MFETHLTMQQGIITSVRTKKNREMENVGERASSSASSSPSEQIKHLTQEEIAKLLGACSMTRNALRNYSLIQTSYLHGLRVSEAARLEWRDIDFKQGQIFVKRSKGSMSGYQRLVPDEIKPLTKLYKLRVNQFVFNSEQKTPITRQQANNMIRKLGLSVGIEDVHFHMLRHSCGVHMALKGVPTINIAQWLGHKRLDSTDIYTRMAAMINNSIAVDSEWWK